MTGRDDLTEAVANVLRDYDIWPDDNAPWDDYRLVAGVVLDALLPQITTAEQLDALRLRPSAVLVSDSGDALVVTEQGNLYDGLFTHEPAAVLTAYGPLTVVWQPGGAA